MKVAQDNQDILSVRNCHSVKDKQEKIIKKHLEINDQFLRSEMEVQPYVYQPSYDKRKHDFHFYILWG